MSDFEQLMKKQNKTFILVFINFALFMILFAGMGYVSWQSAALVNRLKGDLDRAEQTIAQLQTRFQQMDTEVIADRLVATASKRISESIKEVIQGPNVTGQIVQASEKLAATHDMIEQNVQAIQGIHETVKELGNEEIAALVSYQILKGLGDGFKEAAETRKPDSINNE
jgi:5'-deoxynucleotidase YfbR-like HD superfamily hydrolase